MPPNDALMLAVILLLVAVVVMSKIAELVPAGTVTVAGTLAFVGLLLIRVTTASLGVILLSVTVPTELEPPITDVGSKASDENAAGYTGVRRRDVTESCRADGFCVYGKIRRRQIRRNNNGTRHLVLLNSHSPNSRRLRSPAPGA